MKHTLLRRPAASPARPLCPATPPDAHTDANSGANTGMIAAFTGGAAMGCAGLAGFAFHCGDDTAALLLSALAAGGLILPLAFR